MWQLYALLSALFASLTAIFAKIGVSGINSNLATAIRTAVILVFTWGVAFATVEMREMRAISAKGFTFLIISGLCTGASWLFYFRALQAGPASKVAPFEKLSVVFTILLAFLFLGETMSPRLIIGGALILAGALVIAS